MRKKVLTAVMAGALSVSMVIPVFATSGGGAVPSASGTEVWAGIMLEDPDAKLKVEVPTLFAFVVNGSVATNATGVTSTNGGIMLPNVKVNVTTPSVSGSGAVYSISATSDGTMKFLNYSTKDNGGVREGLEVKINGNIKNEGTPISRNYWEHVAAIASTAAAPVTTEFKQYNISIDSVPFSTAQDGGLTMATPITLSAPDVGHISGTTYSNLNTTTNLANTGTLKTVDFDVKVGGQKDQYKQVEQSAKVGTIVWTISTEVQANVNTAPNENYLQ